MDHVLQSHVLSNLPLREIHSCDMLVCSLYNTSVPGLSSLSVLQIIMTNCLCDCESFGSVCGEKIMAFLIVEVIFVPWNWRFTAFF